MKTRSIIHAAIQLFDRDAAECKDELAADFEIAADVLRWVLELPLESPHSAWLQPYLGESCGEEGVGDANEAGRN